MVKAMALAEKNQVVEHLQNLCAGVVDSAYHSSALVGQHPQQGHTLQAIETVQCAASSIISYRE